MINLGRVNPDDDSMKITVDTVADVHIGDTVRFVYYDYRTRGKFYGLAGTVTELRGTGWLGVHFPHYARGTNLTGYIGNFRLMQCVHGTPCTECGGGYRQAYLGDQGNPTVSTLDGAHDFCIPHAGECSRG